MTVTDLPRASALEGGHARTGTAARERGKARPSVMQALRLPYELGQVASACAIFRRRRGRRRGRRSAQAARGKRRRLAEVALEERDTRLCLQPE